VHWEISRPPGKNIRQCHWGKKYKRGTCSKGRKRKEKGEIARVNAEGTKKRPGKRKYWPRMGM
jgi:hypothetical protein